MRILGTAEHTASKSAGKVANVLVAAALALGMTFGVGAQALAPDTAYAAGYNSPAKDKYTYTVRVFSGQQGTFAGGDTCVKFPPITVGENIQFNPGNVYLKDSSKYYVKGWKLAGKDDVTKNHQNNDSLLLSNVKVDADMDLVVCYGVLVDSVGYTVRYVDQQGNELYPTESFYGNVGDSPVLAYRYIEGYLPQAYNLTGELYRDPAQNVYTFTYTPLAVPEQVTEQLPTVVTPAPAAGEAAGAAPAEAITPEDAPAVAVDVPADEEIIGDDGTPLAQPAQVEDIRDEETPMASLNSLARGDSLGEDAGMLFGQSPLMMGLGIGLFVVVAAGIVFLLVYRQKQTKQRKMVASAASQAIASGYTVDPASLVEDEIDINYNPLSNQAGYADPAQTNYYAPQATNPQQYAVQPDAQQLQAPYADQQYGNTQYGGQTNGQYDQYGQYNSQFGSPDDQ